MYWSYSIVQLLSFWIYFLKHRNIFAFSIVSLYWDSAAYLKSFLVEDKDLFTMQVNSMAADGLVMFQSLHQIG